MPLENGAGHATPAASSWPGSDRSFSGERLDLAQVSPTPQVRTALAHNDGSAPSSTTNPAVPGYSARSRGEPIVIIIVTPTAYGKRGQLFSASVDGRIIFTASVTPFCSAARVLAGEGVDPATRIVMRHAGQSYDALVSTVGDAVGLTVVDEGDGVPRFRPWKAFSRPAVAPPMRQTEEACTATPRAPGAPVAPAAGDAP
jgi:hypothetical protein